GMAYGQLAGVTPVAGPYTAYIAMIFYALFASSRYVMIGPDSTTAILVAASVAPLVAGGDPARYATLVALLTIMVGVIAIIAGIVRIGFIADFVSKPILIGYMDGAALIIIESQLGKLFGITTSGNSFFEKLWSIIIQLGQTQWLTFAIGLTLITLLIILRRISPKIPGAILVVVLSTFASWLFHLDAHGVSILGQIPAGLPKPTIPNIQFGDIGNLLPAAFSLALLAYVTGIIPARVSAEKKSEKLDANQECIAIGVANLTAGFCQGFIAAGSQSRTGVNDASGGKTQLVSLVAAVLLIIFLLWFTPLLQLLPLVALAAIVIVAAAVTLQINPVRNLFKVRATAGYLALATFIGVLVVGVLGGIILAVILSLLLIIQKLMRPNDAVLGAIEGIDGFHAIDQHENSETIPGLIVYRFDAPLFFANANYFVKHARQLIAEAETPVEWFLVDAERIFDMDITAADVFRTLLDEFEREQIVLAIARASQPVYQMLERTGLADRIGTNHFFPTVRTGVQAFIECENMPVEEDQPANAIQPGQVDEPKDRNTILD
ncbi:MAG: SulP family inorganic anion transporter, partial [Ktedonobacteraceae bacterium]